MVSFKNFLLLANVAVASVHHRDVAKTLHDLETINADTIALTVALNAYTGGVAGALPILDVRNKLEKGIESATSNAEHAGPASVAEARNIINYISGTVEPSMKASLEVIKIKKPLFNAAELTATVKNILQSLKSRTDKLGAALIAHPLSPLASEGKAILARVDVDIQVVINFYS